MAQYINKDATLAEIKRQYEYIVKNQSTEGAGYILGFRQACWQISDYIDTLEVKEIDGEPRTSAENNDQIAYGHIADNDEKK